MSQVIDEVRAFLRENFLLDAGTELGERASFMESHILDSTGFMELIAFLEERYGLKVADEEMLPENFDSLAAIEAWLGRKRGTTP